MLAINNLNFSYQSKEILKNINFQLEEGSVLALIGESGCGKSTLLKIIYGLLDVNSGNITWNNKKILGPSHHLVPGMAFAKYLAQDFDLMPFTTVSENIGSFLSNFFPEEKKQRIMELLEVVEMTEYASVKVKFLSGGQMQRVALAKVLAKEPELLLLDEPFSHIDNFRKYALRRNLFKYIKTKNITCIVATHDKDDVLSFSNETIVMKEGCILLKKKTQSVYENPPTFYIASLFDEVSQIGEQLVYPHQFEIDANAPLEVNVTNSFYKGSHYLIEAVFDDKVVFFESKNALEIHKKVGLKIKTDL